MSICNRPADRRRFCWREGLSHWIALVPIFVLLFVVACGGSTSAETYDSRARSLLDEGRLDEAVAEADKAIQKDEAYALAHLTRGEILLKLQRPDEGIASYERALELDPNLRSQAAANLAPAYEARAKLRGSAGDLVGSLQDYNRRFDFGGVSAELRKERGIVSIRVGAYKDALADFDHAVLLNRSLQGELQLPRAQAQLEGRLKGKIAFVDSSREAGIQISVLSFDTLQVTRVTTNERAISNQPSLSPDGTRVAFVSNPGGNPDIWVANVDGSGLTRVTDSPATDGAPSWTADGRLVFSSDRDGDFELYITTIAGEVAQLTRNTARDDFPRVSPDGTRIAFVSQRDGNFEIYSMALDGSDVRRLTVAPAFDAGAAWSPDGASILFHTTRDGNQRIYMMGADGSRPSRITGNTMPQSAISASWSPDGAFFVYGFVATANSSDYVLIVSAIDGSLEVPLRLGAAPSWSK